MMNPIFKEPLLHFFVIGVALFGLYAWLQRGPITSPAEVIVSRGQVQNLQMQFERVWQRQPTSDELQGIIDNWVKEEIFYREGIVMGLDRDDPVVRRRVGQKLEFILDSAVPAKPTDAELQTWLDAHPDDYRIEPTYSLRQVFFDPKRHGDKLSADIATSRRVLSSGKPVDGDTTLLPPTLDKARESEVERVFGAEFVAGLKKLPVGGWQGPIRSDFGMHLIELNTSVSGDRALLNDVRAQVERDLLRSRTNDAKDALYKKLLANYNVRIEADGSSPSG